MKRNFFVFTLVLSIALFSCISQRAPEPQLTGSSVWKVSRDGNTMFLGGSIHILRESDFPLPNEFALAFSRSDALVFEADIGGMLKPEVVAYLMSRMVMTDGQTLQTMLTPDTYKMLASAATELGLPLEAVHNFKPPMVTTILLTLQMQRLGITQLGVDFYYFDKAMNANKPVYFLESIESQINALVSMGQGYEDDFVRHSLQDMQNTETFLTTIISDWRTGEAASTKAALTSMYEDWPNIYQSLILNRRNAWMPQIEEFLDSGRTFFVIVGLAHMHGPDGILRLLEDSGSSIEQLK